MASSRRTGALALTAALAALVAAWLWLARDPAPLSQPASTTPAAGGPQVVAAAATDERAGEPPEPDREIVATAADADAADAAPVLRVRLRGLVPEAPWTTPVKLDLDGRDEEQDRWEEHEARATVDEHGVAEFPLPAWVAFASRQQGRIELEDPNYRPLRHRIRGAPDTGEELVLDVEAIAALEGRVVDARGEPVVAAKVSAFALDTRLPGDTEVGSTTTSQQGTYHLEAAPGVRLRLVVAPMQPARISGALLTGRHGAIADLGVLRADLLPAAVDVFGTVGVVGQVPEIVLSDAATVRGVVRWPDGTPVGKAKVAGPDLWRELLRGVTNTFDAAVWSDDDGRFELPARPGECATLELQAVAEFVLSRPLFTRTDPAPAEVRIELPLPVTLRAVRGAATIGRAVVEVDGKTAHCDKNGELRVLAIADHRVRATSGPHRSQWLRVTPHDAGTTIDLPLTEKLTRVLVGFEGEPEVLGAHFASQRAGEGTVHAELRRRPGAGPFELFLPAGGQTLRVEAGRGEPNAKWFVPITKWVEVGTEELELRWPSPFGGRPNPSIAPR
ncbi:MAG: carboxypeptidase regulatory-like domain-containing protein [Planctomycetes bacterium]|nr:carboxypeptidase regulatory-like domain-containing protein [Planctomycetota bacterium]